MKIEVVYFSKTGHSRKIAQAIATALQVEARDIASTPILRNVDLLFIVGGIYGGVSDPKLLDYIRRIDRQTVKRAALLTSCASSRMKQDQVRGILTGNHVEVVAEEFICPGSLFYFIKRGHPIQQDLADAVTFANRIAAGKS